MTTCDGPHSEGDYVIEWLIAKPRRLRIGDLLSRSTKQEPARRLIARFAPHCSDAVLSALERAVFSYVDPDLKRMLMFDHERVAYGQHYPNYHGRDQYVLASAIPIARLSGASRDQLGMWQRKFGNAPIGSRVRSSGGWVGSTIPSERVHCITDEHWLKIASADWSAKRHRHKIMGPDQVGEASHEHFASNMGGMTRRQPSRFAKLALRLPPNAPADYLRQILRGLEQKDPPETLTKARDQNKEMPERVKLLEKELASWRAATREEIEAILGKLGYPDDAETAKAICWLVMKRDDIIWSHDTIDLIARLATNHPDPAPEQFHTQHANGDDPSGFVSDIANSGLNCVRGEAALALREILFGVREVYNRIVNSIIALTQDSNIAVRAAAISTCCPILNVSRDVAVAHFLAMCNTADDRIILSHYLNDFLRYALWSHPSTLIPIVERMAQSKLDEVAKKGAAWVTAAWLYRGWCALALAACRAGSLSQRRGVAEKAGELSWETETAIRRIELLPALFDDDDTEVRQHVARVFWKHEPWQDGRLIDLAPRFINSRAFAQDPTPIIHGLENIKGSLAPYATVIYAIADQFAGPLAAAARDIQQGVASDAPHLFKLLLRLYQQGQDDRQHDIQVACLDRWDALLHAGVGSYRDTENILDAVDR